MIKKVIKDNYEIEIPEDFNGSEEELETIAKDCIKILQDQETSVKDYFEPISKFKTFKYLTKTEQGHEVIKAFEDLRDHRMHVIVHRPFDNTYIVGIGYSPDDGVWNQGWYDFRSLENAEKALRKEYNVKPFERKTEESVKDSQGEYGYEFNFDPEDFKVYLKKMKEKYPDLSFEELWAKIEDVNEMYRPVFEPEEIEEHMNNLKELFEKKEVDDVFVEDIPFNAPEEKVDITYTEKLKGGKNALTYGMIEEAFKQRNKDDGKTFAAYVDVAIESLKDDIKNAKYLVSGEMKSTRKLLLEDYVKIEHLVEKAGMTEKLNEMKPLVDELSEKLDLNYWKQPKFKPQERKQVSRELRNKHRFDSKIQKSLKPVFLCSKSDLTASYNDAKQGKLPEVFEGNLIKVQKDIEADYDRINQGRDNYLEDPRIVKVLPEIIDLYETAIKYAEDLGYKEIATQFAYMLTTIKKGWGLE